MCYISIWLEQTSLIKTSLFDATLTWSTLKGFPDPQS
jgi:hypothetical protein